MWTMIFALTLAVAICLNVAAFAIVTRWKQVGAWPLAGLAIGTGKAHIRTVPTYNPKFIIRPSQVGVTWSVWLVGGSKAAEEIRDFQTLREANDWIDSKSQGWLGARHKG